MLSFRNWLASPLSGYGVSANQVTDPMKCFIGTCSGTNEEKVLQDCRYCTIIIFLFQKQRILELVDFQRNPAKEYRANLFGSKQRGQLWYTTNSDIFSLVESFFFGNTEKNWRQIGKEKWHYLIAEEMEMRQIA